jgi:hypothetical protein
MGWLAVCFRGVGVLFCSCNLDLVPCLYLFAAALPGSSRALACALINKICLLFKKKKTDNTNKLTCF